MPDYDLEDIYEKVARALADGALAGDKRRHPMICLGLCELILDELDVEQRAALEDARRFWAGEASEAVRREWLERLWKRNDEYSHAGLVDTKVKSLNRLVLGTLHTNVELTIDCGDALIYIADCAGLSASQMASVFTRYLPKFE